MKVRIICKPDNSVSIIYPAWSQKRDEQTEEQFLDTIQNKMPDLKKLPFYDCDESELPEDRQLRHCWEFDNTLKKIKINQQRA